MTYRDLNSLDYKKWRKRVYARDKYTCRFPGCNKRGGYLEAHHIRRFSQYPQLRYVISNGITLCKAHHDMVFGQEELYEIMFLEIIAPKKKKVTNIDVDIIFRSVE